MEREKRRISDGKKMTEIKQDMADKEIIRLAEERRREKLETLAAKEKIKKQIQVSHLSSLVWYFVTNWALVLTLISRKLT